MHTQTSRPEKPVTIAVLDDKKEYVEHLTAAIEAAGYAAIPIVVQPSTSIEEIVEKARGAHIVLLDHSMYGFTGKDVSERLPYSTKRVSTSNAHDAPYLNYCLDTLPGKDMPHRYSKTDKLIRLLVSSHIPCDS